MSKPFKPWAFPADAIHISIDLETAATDPHAAIVQIGAACYQHTTGHDITTPEVASFNIHISLSHNEFHKRTVDKETMEWWDKQDRELCKRVFSGTAYLDTALASFVDWCATVSDGNLDRVVLWGNGCNFDNVILKDACEQFMSWPFNFRNDHHLRTLMALVPPDVQERAHERFIAPPGTMPHDALYDALYQLNMIRTGLTYHGIHP